MAQDDRPVGSRFTFLWLSALVTSFGFHLLTARLPLYAANLGADDVAVGLLAGLIAAVALFGRPAVGWWMDRGSGAGPLLLGIILYVLTAVGYWLAPSVAVLLAVRAVAGLAVSLHAIAGHTLAIHLVPVQRRGEILSLYALAHTIAQGTAPPAGVSIVGRVGDAALFAAVVGLNLLAFALAWPLRGIRRPPAEHARRTIIHRAVLVPGLLMLAAMVMFGVNFALLPLHANRRGLTNPGLVFVANSIGLLVVQSFAGRLSDRLGRLAVVGPGLAVAALGMYATSALSGGWLFLGAGLAGMGLGASLPALQALAADLVPPGERGTAMGTLGVFHEIGVILGAVGGGFIGRSWGLGSTYAVASLIAGAAALAASVLHRAQIFSRTPVGAPINT